MLKAYRFVEVAPDYWFKIPDKLYEQFKKDFSLHLGYNKQDYLGLFKKYVEYFSYGDVSDKPVYLKEDVDRYLELLSKQPGKTK